MKITINGNSRIIGGISAISSASPAEVHDNRKTANTDGPWKALFFRTAIAANCLPSSFVDANDHVIKAIDALRVAPAASSAPASPATGIEVELVRDKVYGSMNIRKWTAIGELSEGKHAFLQAATRDAPSDPALPAWFDTFLTNVCELSDRNSPAEERDAIIATLAELSNCALNAIEQETK